MKLRGAKLWISIAARSAKNPADLVAALAAAEPRRGAVHVGIEDDVGSQPLEDRRDVAAPERRVDLLNRAGVSRERQRRQRLGEPDHSPTLTIPAATVSWLDSSTRMNAPVAWHCAYGSAAISPPSRSCTCAMSLSRNSSAAGHSSDS
jgi:hypothetical protein